MILLKIIAVIGLYVFLMFSLTIAISIGVSVGIRMAGKHE